MFSFFCSLDFQTSLLGLAPKPEERAIAGQCPPRAGSHLHDTFLGAPRFSSLCSSSLRRHTCFLQWLPVCRLGDPLFTFAAIYLLCIQFPALNSADSQPIPLFLTEPRPVLSCGFLLITNFDVFLKLFGVCHLEIRFNLYSLIITGTTGDISSTWDPMPSPWGLGSGLFQSDLWLEFFF